MTLYNLQQSSKVTKILYEILLFYDCQKWYAETLEWPWKVTSLFDRAHVNVFGLPGMVKLPQNFEFTPNIALSYRDLESGHQTVTNSNEVTTRVWDL